MALNNLGLGIMFSAKDRASGPIGRINRNFKSLDEQVSRGSNRMARAVRDLGVGFASLKAGTAAFRGLGGLAKQAGEFEFGLAAVGAVTKASAQQMDLLAKAATQAGIKTEFSPDQAVQGLMNLSTAGQTAEQSVQSLIPVLNLASGSMGQIGVGEAAEAVVGTLNAYAMSADNAGKVTDKLLRITQLTNFQTRDFGVGLSKAAAFGAQFGTDLDDVLLTMGLLRNRNIDASSAATAFREAIRRLGSDQNAQKKVTKAGVEIFDKSTGAMRSVVDIMHDLGVATADMTQKERNRIAATAFGARGLLAFNAITEAQTTVTRDGVAQTLKGQRAIDHLRIQLMKAEPHVRKMNGDYVLGTKALEKMRGRVSLLGESIKTSTGEVLSGSEALAHLEEQIKKGGTAAEFNAKKAATFKGQLNLLKGSVQTLGISLGTPLLGALTKAIERMRSGIDRILKWWEGLDKSTKKMIMSVASLAAGLMTAFGALMVVRGGLALLRHSFGTLGIGKLFGSFKSLIPLIAVLAPLIGGVKIAWDKDMGGIQTKTRSGISKIKLGFRSLIELFMSGELSKELKAELDKAENQGLKRFIDKAWSFFKKLGEFFSGVGSGFAKMMETAGPAVDALMRAFDNLGDALGEAFGGFGKTAGGAEEFGSTGEKVGAVLGKIAIAGIHALSLLVNVLSELIRIGRGIWDAVGPTLSKVGQAIAWVVDKVSELVEWLTSLWGSSDKVGESGEKAAGTMNKVGKAIGIAAMAILGAKGLLFAFRTLKTIIGGATSAGGRFLTFLGNLGPSAAAANNTLTRTGNTMTRTGNTMRGLTTATAASGAAWATSGAAAAKNAKATTTATAAATTATKKSGGLGGALKTLGKVLIVGEIADFMTDVGLHPAWGLARRHFIKSTAAQLDALMGMVGPEAAQEFASKMGDPAALATLFERAYAPMMKNMTATQAEAFRKGLEAQAGKIQLGLTEEGRKALFATMTLGGPALEEILPEVGIRAPRRPEAGAGVAAANQVAMALGAPTGAGGAAQLAMLAETNQSAAAALKQIAGKETEINVLLDGKQIAAAISREGEEAAGEALQ